MRKALFLLLGLAVLLGSGMGLSAQEVTITLKPGWTWIGFPYVEEKSVIDAFPGFVPLSGDQIKSKAQTSMYDEDEEEWSGNLQTLIPGQGYMYYSTRPEAVSVVLGSPSSSSSVTVTTIEPTNINYYSAICGGTVTVADGDHVFMRGVCWGTEPNPTIDDNHTIDEAGIGGWTVQVYGLAIGTTYHVRAYAVTDSGLKYGEDFSFTTKNISGGGELDYVDLGLPSGILWATCNVGADSPEEYGDYFAWGETQPKDDYNWSTYQYCNGSPSTLTKYCNNSSYGYNGFTDNLTTLLSEDDAASANLGNEWRMPTKEEWLELYNNTTMTWTTQNGVNGRLFTASNGNSLFLPAAGCRWHVELNDAGSYGYYWSSTLYTVNPNRAWYFCFDSGNYYMDYYNRFFGRSVRAVRSGQNITSYVIDATVNPAEGGTIVGTGSYEQSQACTLTATANSGYTFVNWTENDEVVSTDATYTFTVDTSRTLVANFNLDHAYVDLGLPSGLLWATCNVGAENPEDYGDYFAWGETQPKENCDWTTYQYCNGDYNTLTKYCNDAGYGYNGFTDNLTTLLPEDDAATANWGGDWRMPTQAEFQELLDNTTVTWTTQNGVNGRLFTAPNGNSLFLPAAGYRYDSSLDLAGSYGYYWSSTLYTDYPYYAWFFYFDSDNYDMGNSSRYYGQSVRPVRSGQN